jgi:hypothetical protein
MARMEVSWAVLAVHREQVCSRLRAVNNMVKRLTTVELMRVQRLLARGWRHVEIARELELSLWTIQRIANDPDLQADPLPEGELPVDDAPPDYSAAEIRRCSGCGGMVYHWPCLACRDLTSPKAEPAEEVIDELADRVGWDALGGNRESGVGSRGIRRWGQRAARTKGNAEYRKQLARAGRFRS